MPIGGLLQDLVNRSFNLRLVAEKLLDFGLDKLPASLVQVACINRRIRIGVNDGA